MAGPVSLKAKSYMASDLQTRLDAAVALPENERAAAIAQALEDAEDYALSLGSGGTPTPTPTLIGGIAIGAAGDGIYAGYTLSDGENGPDIFANLYSPLSRRKRYLTSRAS